MSGVENNAGHWLIKHNHYSHTLIILLAICSIFLAIESQSVFENECGFAEKGLFFPLKGEGWGGGLLEGINILKIHDLEMYQMVDSMSTWALEGAGWFKTVDGILSQFQPIKWQIL